MLERKIEKEILSWLRAQDKALLIDGARQVGKTYIIRKVLQSADCELVEFNLLKTPQLCTLLAKSESVDDMVTNLSLYEFRQVLLSGLQAGCNKCTILNNSGHHTEDGNYSVHVQSTCNHTA